MSVDWENKSLADRVKRMMQEHGDTLDEVVKWRSTIFYQQFLATAPEDVADREQTYQQQRAMAEFQAFLHNLANSDKAEIPF